MVACFDTDHWCRHRSCDALDEDIRTDPCRRLGLPDLSVHGLHLHRHRGRKPDEKGEIMNKHNSDPAFFRWLMWALAFAPISIRR
jgi:hypothetical protein